jgi:hypothetical protein
VYNKGLQFSKPNVNQIVIVHKKISLYACVWKPSTHRFTSFNARMYPKFAIRIVMNDTIKKMCLYAKDVSKDVKFDAYFDRSRMKSQRQKPRIKV